MWLSPQETVDFVTFTEETSTLSHSLHFLYSDANYKKMKITVVLEYVNTAV